ncbi:S41 family peptidase [Haloferula sp. BvORR071]|uniref:S41 family peptidase n=1 Tax=Haloferula sp. BvORR071 TaxID=1396141 RepID=UPI00069624A1|nr:S41 family peptidase [Haloferula sp. BvORR071]
MFPLALLALAPLTASAAPGYYRSPALSGDTVVFTAEGDLWKIPLTGGVAQRLSSHPGVETSATISPDGSQVAFSAQYEGPIEAYVMPIAGGLPKRLTWSGEGTVPVGWTRDGKVLCTTKAHSTLPNDQLVAIDPANGTETLVPLAQASDGTWDDTGKRLFFTRLPFQGSSTKRYEGGTVQNLWRYDEGTPEALPLVSDYRGTSKNPMWWQGRVYFLCDQSGTMNLWAMTAEGTDRQQLTKYTDFDIRNADLNNGRIVYQQAGNLHAFDLKDSSDREIQVSLSSDFDQTRERWVKNPFEYLTEFNVSPNGDRLVLTARGSVFVAPVKPGGRFVEIPHKQGVRYREAHFMPDGKSLIAQTDETGEIELVKLPANGIGTSELLTQDGTIFRFAPITSPDGKWVTWQDKNNELWVRDLETKQSVKVSTSPGKGFEDLVWSPDSKWLAFVEPAPNSFDRIRLYHVTDGKTIEATSDRVISGFPAWSPDGKWLWFLSDRELKSLVKSPWGPRQPEPYFAESTHIYALALQKNGRFPFTPPDELSAEADKAEQEANKKKDKEEDDKPKAAVTINIDPDGLQTRIYEVPGVSGNLTGLTATAKQLFYMAEATGGDSKPRLMRLDINSDAPKPKLFAEDPKGWNLSQDGKWIAFRNGNNFHVVESGGEAPAKLEKSVPLDGWDFAVSPKEEWHQIYRESWRMLRDYFYDPAMHGVDWTAIRAKYEPLVDRVADRSDLGDILHEMSGELSALHIFVRFGDLRDTPDSIQPSLLGAQLARDPATSGWAVQQIYQTDPDYPGETSPLSRPGVGIKEGDIIMAINGRDLAPIEFPQELLEQKAGQQVLLDVQAKEGGIRRKVLVKPLSPPAEADLRYSSWEYTRRLATEDLGKGRIGYVHLRAMGAESILEWARNFYPIFDRQGLIIDMRHNRGGNTDSWILGRLLRKAWFHWAPRAGQPYSNMQFAFRGHVVVLCNEFTASDGEAFSEGFRRLGLGKVIGTRTWGGQIWLSSQRWLVDNGMCTAAEFGVYGPEGQWLIEGTGVEPDEVVDNAPHQTFLGKDAQLEAGVKHLQDLIAKDPRPVPQPPPRPNKAPR